MPRLFAILALGALLVGASYGAAAPAGARPTRDAAKPPSNQRDVKARPLDRVPSGLWGGEHIALEATEKGATIEYDCAHSSIDVPITVDAGGRFDVKGLHVREHGGPIRQGEEGNGLPARFTGQTDGKTMTLKVTLDSGETVGTFALKLGVTPRIVKCY